MTKCIDCDDKAMESKIRCESCEYGLWVCPPEIDKSIAEWREENTWSCDQCGLINGVYNLTCCECYTMNPNIKPAV